MTTTFFLLLFLSLAPLAVVIVILSVVNEGGVVSDRPRMGSALPSDLSHRHLFPRLHKPWLVRYDKTSHAHVALGGPGINL